MESKEGRNQAVIEEVYRLMGQPVPAALQNPSPEEELEDEEELEEEEFEEEEEEEDEDIVRELDDADNVAEFKDSLGIILDRMATLPAADVVANPNWETPAAKHTRIHKKRMALKVIESVDSFISTTFRRLLEDALTYRKEALESLYDTNAKRMWQGITGIHLSEHGEVGLIFKSTYLSAPHDHKVFNVVIRPDDYDNSVIQVPHSNKVMDQLMKMDTIAQPARDIISGDHLILHEEGLVDSLWSNSPKPKMLKIETNGEGAWSLDRMSEDGDMDQPEVEFPLEEKFWWLNANPWKDLPVILLYRESGYFSNNVISADRIR